MAGMLWFIVMEKTKASAFPQQKNPFLRKKPSQYIGRFGHQRKANNAVPMDKNN